MLRSSGCELTTMYHQHTHASFTNTHTHTPPSPTHTHTLFHFLCPLTHNHTELSVVCRHRHYGVLSFDAAVRLHDVWCLHWIGFHCRRCQGLFSLTYFSSLTYADISSHYFLIVLFPPVKLISKTLPPRARLTRSFFLSVMYSSK